MSLRSSSQQPPGIYVKCDRPQPQIEPVTQDLSPARDTARPCRRNFWQSDTARRLSILQYVTPSIYLQEPIGFDSEPAG